ncbi:hypothetical protein CASFOL_041232 [Castilleja foliolosa]|uniref:Uncharacterized protein n=1 Tax=Castilleja foliolosa TaxID=1961234 RepID=A0ABD3BET1_9LAMI
MWMNYLKPGIKMGNFSNESETVFNLHEIHGNRKDTKWQKILRDLRVCFSVEAVLGRGSHKDATGKLTDFDGADAMSSDDLHAHECAMFSYYIGSEPSCSCYNS